MSVRNNLLMVALAVAVSGACSSEACAQLGRSRIQYPLGRPAVSPYLNLLGVNSAAYNFYGIVRPQQQLYQTSQDLQQGLYYNMHSRYHQQQYQANGIRNGGQAGQLNGSSTPALRATTRTWTTGHVAGFSVPGRQPQDQQQPGIGGLSAPGIRNYGANTLPGTPGRTFRTGGFGGSAYQFSSPSYGIQGTQGF